MPHYTSSRVVSVRLPAELLDALKAKAKDDGRSVSGAITLLVKENVASRATSKKAPGKIAGCFAHLAVPESSAAWRAARARASATLMRSVGSKPARRPGR